MRCCGPCCVSLEDEAGQSERQRLTLLQSRLLAVQGRRQREGDVCNVAAARLVDLTPLLGRLAEATKKSRDFH
jgi:error-prone DNA polymerase